MFTLSIILLILAAIAYGVSFGITPVEYRKWPRIGAAVTVGLAVIGFAFSMFVTVPASHIAVVTTFGQVERELLSEGAHFIAPWRRTHNIPVSTDVAAADKAEAGSKDLQTVHATLTTNYHVDPARVRDLYQLNPGLNYEAAFVVPAMYEVFKSVVAHYTAEELITKRTEVSDNIVKALNTKLASYYLQVHSVNLVNFGFSRSFDAAIEEKVTANQKAATAENNLKRTKFEAEQRIAQAEGEAKAIAIQAAAVEKSGGVGYVQLQAIAKWDGKLPQYVTAVAPMPFLNAAAK